MADNNRQNIQIKFESVRTKRFEVSEPDRPIDHEGLEFYYTVEVGANDHSTEGVVNVDIDVVESARPEHILAEIATTTIFAIRGLDDGDPESSAPLPRDLMMTLTSLAVSTTRGILVERTANTELGTVILPPFDPVAFFDANDEPASAAPPMT